MICVCAQIRKDGHMEENAQKFLEKMNELVALGKKKKSILDVQEINDFFCGHGIKRRTDGKSF